MSKKIDTKLLTQIFDISKLKGIDFKTIDKDEFKKGMEVEKEHSKDLTVRAIITLGHMAEKPYYYTKLLKAEL